MTALADELADWLQSRIANPLGLEQAVICVSETWSSESEGHRLAIRTAVGEKLNISEEENLSRLKNLREIPRLANHALSISHCPDLGGFVLIPNFTGSIGFDVEIGARITVPIAERVLPHPSELCIRERLLRPDAPLIAASIWTAKEAAIKCFGNAFAEQTMNYVNVELLDLQSEASLGFSFTARFGTNIATGRVAPLQHRMFAISGTKVRQ